MMMMMMMNVDDHQDHDHDDDDDDDNGDEVCSFYNDDGVAFTHHLTHRSQVTHVCLRHTVKFLI